MEWSILFIGPAGAGKSEAVRTLSDIEVIDTEAVASDASTLLKHHTTVAMDMGVLHLDGQDKIRLYGAPGQDRFDFMWDILLAQSKGVILLINHANPDPLGDLGHYLDQLHLRMGSSSRPLVIGITHADQQPDRSLEVYRNYLETHPAWRGAACIPVLEMDARQFHDTKTVLLTLASMLEMNERFPRRPAV